MRGALISLIMASAAVCCVFSEESLLTPILSTLNGVAKESRDIRRYIKTAVFQEAVIALPGPDSKHQNTSANRTLRANIAWCTLMWS